MKRSIDPITPQRLQSLLLKSEVQRELDIDSRTYMLIFQAQRELRERIKESEGEPVRPDFSDREAMKEYLEKRKAEAEEREAVTKDALTEVFPPESYKRLKQIAYQIQIKEAGLGNVLVYGVIGDELELNESQWQQVSKLADELEQEKQEKIRAIVEQYDKKLLDSLPSKQRRKFQEIVGEPFEYQVLHSEQEKFERLKRYKHRTPVGP